MIRYITPSGFGDVMGSRTQHSASLHVGLRVRCPFGTGSQPRSGTVLAAQGAASLRAEPWVRGTNLFFIALKGRSTAIVKGGENVNVATVRDLKGTVEREKAEMAFFVTLSEPTRPMKEEAVSACFYVGNRISEAANPEDQGTD